MKKDIEKIRQLRGEIEMTLHATLATFETETGCTIKSIDIDRHRTISGNDPISIVCIDVELGRFNST